MTELIFFKIVNGPSNFGSNCLLGEAWMVKFLRKTVSPGERSGGSDRGVDLSINPHFWRLIESKNASRCAINSAMLPDQVLGEP